MNQEQLERLKKMKERAEQLKVEAKEKELEYFNQLTSGTGWKTFKGGMIFCALLMILTTIDTLVDGKKRKVGKQEYKFNRELYAIDYQSVWVEDALFAVHFQDLFGFDETSFELVYSSVFQQPKKLLFDQEASASSDSASPRKRSAMRALNIYTWFPYLQIVLLIPLLLYIFKRPTAIFTFVRMLCLILLYPSAILLLGFLVF